MIDENDKLITLREIPKMSLIKCKIEEKYIIFSVDGQKDLLINREFDKDYKKSKISLK